MSGLRNTKNARQLSHVGELIRNLDFSTRIHNGHLVVAGKGLASISLCLGAGGRRCQDGRIMATVDAIVQGLNGFSGIRAEFSKNTCTLTVSLTACSEGDESEGIDIQLYVTANGRHQRRTQKRKPRKANSKRPATNRRARGPVRR